MLYNNISTTKSTNISLISLPDKPKQSTKKLLKNKTDITMEYNFLLVISFPPVLLITNMNSTTQYCCLQTHGDRKQKKGFVPIQKPIIVPVWNSNNNRELLLYELT